MKGTDLLTPALTTCVLLFATQDRSTAEQNELFTLLASDGTPDQWFGSGMAVSGGRIVVGAPRPSGRVYLYDRSTGQELGQLTSADTALDDLFGWSVALEGNLLVVGAPQDDDNGSDSGSAYVFDASTGQQLFKLLPSDGVVGAQFGWGVSVSGGHAVISAIYDNERGHRSGAAYVFDVNTGQEIWKLYPGDGAPKDFFGRGVSLSGDLFIGGADGNDDLGDRSGAAYIFEVSTGRQLLKLLPTDGHALQHFGMDVSLCDGFAIVGAPGDDDHGYRSGAAYVYDATTGSLLHKLHSSDIDAFDFFGASVFIDGNQVAVEAQFDESSYYGRVFTFDVTSGAELSMLRNSDNALLDFFGTALCIDADRLVVGAFGADHLGSDSGAAYVFEVPVTPGAGYCFGDPLSGTPCPCGNNNDRSVPGSGCDNGVYASGARLSATGVAKVSADTVTLLATHLEPNNSGLYFQANTDLSPGIVWGDGLRCAGGGEVRLQVRVADAAGSSQTTVPIATKGNVSPGDTRRYQVWYRTIIAPPCGHGVHEFNTTNGYTIAWRP